MCRILALTVRSNVSKPTLRAIVRIKVLEIFEFRIAQFRCSIDELVLGTFGSEGTAGDIDWPVVAMVFPFSSAMICLKLSTKLSSCNLPTHWKESYLFQKGVKVIG